MAKKIAVTIEVGGLVAPLHRSRLFEIGQEREQKPKMIEQQQRDEDDRPLCSRMPRQNHSAIAGMAKKS